MLVRLQVIGARSAFRKRMTDLPLNLPTINQPRRACCRQEKDGSKAAVKSATKCWTRTCTTTQAVLPGSKKVPEKADQKAYYPQIHHYFRSNENSYESTVRNARRRRRKAWKAPPKPCKVGRAIDALAPRAQFFVTAYQNVFERPRHRPSAKQFMFDRQSGGGSSTTTAPQRARPTTASPHPTQNDVQNDVPKLVLYVWGTRKTRKRRWP